MIDWKQWRLPGGTERGQPELLGGPDSSRDPGQPAVSWVDRHRVRGLLLRASWRVGRGVHTGSAAVRGEWLPLPRYIGSSRADRYGQFFSGHGPSRAGSFYRC